MPKAFLITPFTPVRAGNEDPRLFEAVQVAIEHAARAAGVNLIHPRQMNAAGVIMDQIQEAIAESDVVLALLTGQNANVFYELGIALERAKRPAIFIVNSPEDVPFDVKHHRYWTYGGDGEIERLPATIEQAIRETLALTPRQALAQRQPPLEKRTTSVSSPLNFRARATALIGRTSELEHLHRFLEAPQPFLWLVIHGPAGSGKSRLALELCLSTSGWASGFLPANHGFEEEWSKWLPNRPTLMVIDDVEQREEDAKLLLEVLTRSEQVTRKPIRVLFLGRERVSHLEKMLKLDVFEWEDLFLQCAFGLPLTLGPLGEEEAMEIIRTIARRTAPSEVVRDEPSLRFPLFATLSGMALADGRAGLSWDRSSVARYVLERRRLQHWTGCGKDDENLLAYVTLAGSPQSTRIVDELSSTGLFPRDPEAALERNQQMTDTSQPQLMPLEPRPLGELFILDLLAQAADPVDVVDRGHKVAECAMRKGPYDLLYRAMRNYPDHPGLPRLLAVMIRAFDAAMLAPIGFGIPILVEEEIPGLVSKGDQVLARAMVEGVSLLEARGYPEAQMVGGYAGAAFYLASALAQCGMFEDALQVLREMKTRAQTDDAFEYLGKAYGNVIISAVEQSLAEISTRLTQQLLELARIRPNLGLYATTSAISGIKLVTSAAQAEVMFEECVELMYRNPDPQSLAANVAQIAFNAANRAQRDGDKERCLRFWDRLLSLRDHGWVPFSLVARTAIPAAIFMDRIPEAEQNHFLRRVEQEAQAHSDDEEGVMNSIRALFNATWSLRIHPRGLVVFEMLCRLASQHPDIPQGRDLCAGAAVQLISANPGTLEQVRRVLASTVPTVFEQEYLTRKEVEWNTDLSALK